MVSRYRRGYALTSTPEGQEFHLHGDQVIKDQTDLSSLSPTTFVRLWFQGNGSHLQWVVSLRPVLKRIPEQFWPAF
jgi:hypothetical protein